MKIIRQLSIYLTWLAAVCLSVSAMAQTPPAGTITYIHNDLLGSPAAATNAAGTVIWREAYSGYGERLKNEAGATANKVWYTSRHQDEDTGLVYMGARYYDPGLGRFLSVDSVGFSELNSHSFNRYSYAYDNPYRFKDPDGRRPISAGNDEPFIYKGGQTAAGPEWSSDNTGAYVIAAGIMLTPVVGELGGAAVVMYRTWRASQVVPKYGEKIEAQLGKRGWTKEEVQEAVLNGEQSSARDTRHVGNTGRKDEAATRYTRSDGSYVVLNNGSGDVVQVSNINKPGFIPHGGN